VTRGDQVVFEEIVYFFCKVGKFLEERGDVGVGEIFGFGVY